MCKLWLWFVLFIPSLAMAYVPNDNSNNPEGNTPNAQNNNLTQMMSQKTADALKTFDKVTYKDMSGDGKDDFFHSQDDDSSDGKGQHTFKIKNSGVGG